MTRIAAASACLDGEGLAFFRVPRFEREEFRPSGSYATPDRVRMTAEMGDMWWVIGDKNVIYVWLLTTNQKKKYAGRDGQSGAEDAGRTRGYTPLAG